MKDTTRKMLDEIGTAHDWAEGQVWGGGGTRLSRTDTCRVCGLRRHYLSDRQNGVEEEYRFHDAETHEDLTMRQAHARKCP